MHKVKQFFSCKTCIFAWVKIFWKGEGKGPIGRPLKQQPQQPADFQPTEVPNHSPALLAEEMICDALKQGGNTSLFSISASYPAWCRDVWETEWYYPRPLSHLGLFIHACARTLLCTHAGTQTHPSPLLYKILLAEERHRKSSKPLFIQITILQQLHV